MNRVDSNHKNNTYKLKRETDINSVNTNNVNNSVLSNHSESNNDKKINERLWKF